MKLPGGGGPWPGTKFGGGNGGPFGAPFGGKGGIIPMGGAGVLVRKWIQMGCAHSPSPAPGGGNELGSRLCQIMHLTNCSVTHAFLVQEGLE
jgi:hypothetical protein